MTAVTAAAVLVSLALLIARTLRDARGRTAAERDWRDALVMPATAVAGLLLAWQLVEVAA